MDNTKELNTLISKLQNLKSGGFTDSIYTLGTTIGVTSATYASGRTLGTGNPVTIEAVKSTSGTAVIQSLILHDKSLQNGAIDVVFFNANPSATTFTNNNALTVNDSDLVKIIAVVSITSADYASFADNSVAVKSNLGIPVKSGNSPYLYYALVSRDAKTYVANEVSVIVSLLQD